VVVSSAVGGRALDATLASLGEQTLSADEYELVVVQRTAAEGSYEAVESARDRFDELSIRYLRLDATPGAAAGAGLAAAGADYVTFVEGGDTVSANYLRGLLDASGPGRVGLALLADIASVESAPDFSAADRLAQLTSFGRVMRARDYLPGLTFAGAKMVATPLARMIGFDATAEQGAEELFWCTLFAAVPFRFGMVTRKVNAVYYRLPRPIPATAGEVGAHLDAIARLDGVAARHDDAQAAIAVAKQALARPLNAYLRAHPDRRAAVVADIQARGLRDFPYRVINAGLARDLVVLYSALPYVDTSALVAARRVRGRGAVVDVLSSAMVPVRRIDRHSEAVWEEFIDRAVQLPTHPTWDDPALVSEYCRLGIAELDAWVAEKGPYRTMYSRAMWPAAHVLAALYKARHPDVRWTAEFSDPMLYDVEGKLRRGKGPLEAALLDELSAAVKASGFEPPDMENLWEIAELLPYAMADEVLYTNDNQRDVMLAYCERPEYAARAREHSIVQHHPTPPAEFYAKAATSYTIDRGVANIGYFGTFYITRGLTEVVDALRLMTASDRARVRLHVFTHRPDKLNADALDAGLADVIVAHPYVSYLEFLAISRRMDVLLVNDFRAAEAHGRNPYLPAKYADYLGSERAIWGIYEPGSVLSGQPLTYRSELGDVAGARRVLTAIAETVHAPLAAAVTT
jgi:glycosyltransferase involved in cell wall biosynthesis